MNNRNKESVMQMMQIITGKWLAKPIYVTAKLGIADILEKGPMKIDEIAEKTGTNSKHLYRVMRALAGFGIFMETEEKHFALTPMGECLKSDALRYAVLMFQSEWHDKVWNQLLYSVQTGENAFYKAHGTTCFEWLESHPEEGDIFNRANSYKAAASHSVIVDSYNFQGIDSITDIGGGYGGLLTTILKAYPKITGTIADIPSVIKRTDSIIKEQKLENRLSTAISDFFLEVPAGSDAYILSNILHDWDDENCTIILNNCHKAMMKESKLLILEMIIPEGNNPSLAKLLDLEVLVMGNGCERTENEFNILLKSTGFRINRIIPTREEIQILECVKE